MRFERGTIVKPWAKNVRVALIFPDRYNIAMSSLSFHSLYRFINGIDGALCDRFVIDWERSIERNFKLKEYDVILFTVPFIMNILSVAEILKKNQISKEQSDKLICTGGIAVAANSNAFSGYVDAVFTGSIEQHSQDIVSIINLMRAGAKKGEIVEYLEGRNIECGHQKSIPLSEIIPPHTVVYTGRTEFANTHLLEIERGCTGTCRFCLIRHLSRRYLEFEFGNILRAIDICPDDIRTVGLVGDSVLSHSHINEIVDYLLKRGKRPALASIRIQDLSDEKIDVIIKSDIKTLTVAPEVATERMMKLIGKRYEPERLFSTLNTLIKEGVQNIKLYLMIGLPDEQQEDIDAIVELILSVRELLIRSSRDKGRTGNLRVTVNNFVPSPFTPLSNCEPDSIDVLKSKQQMIRKGISGIPNINISFMDIYETLLQTAFFRMNEDRARILLLDSKMPLKKRFETDREFTDIITTLCYKGKNL